MRFSKPLFISASEQQDHLESEFLEEVLGSVIVLSSLAPVLLSVPDVSEMANI